jgi:GNAT superfamily N-acetyltransferase
VFRVRPARRADDDAVLELLAAHDLVHYGEADFTRELLLDEWRGAHSDATADAVLIDDERGMPVGYGALFPHGGLAFVDPAHEGAGAGSQLLAWLEARGHADRRDVHRQRVAGRNRCAHELLTAAGYTHLRSVLWLQRELDNAPPLPPVPDAIVLDALDVARDARAVYAVDCAAFAGSPDYEQVAFASFQAEHLASPQLDPSLSRVARRDDALVGFALCRRTSRGGCVDILAVEEAERSRRSRPPGCARHGSTCHRRTGRRCGSTSAPACGSATGWTCSRSRLWLSRRAAHLDAMMRICQRSAPRSRSTPTFSRQ